MLPFFRRICFGVSIGISIYSVRTSTTYSWELRRYPGGFLFCPGFSSIEHRSFCEKRSCDTKSTVDCTDEYLKTLEGKQLVHFIEEKPNTISTTYITRVEEGITSLSTFFGETHDRNWFEGVSQYRRSVTLSCQNLLIFFEWHAGRHCSVWRRPQLLLVRR
jgi:hypothetical protein